MYAVSVGGMSVWNLFFINKQLIMTTKDNNWEERKAELRESWHWLYKEDGSIDEDAMLREISDYEFVLLEVPKVYCHVTGGRISKPNTHASAVIGEVDEQVDQGIEKAKREAVEECAEAAKWYIHNNWALNTVTIEAADGVKEHVLGKLTPKQ